MGATITRIDLSKGTNFTVGPTEVLKLEFHAPQAS
jgi:hypothetical protein